MPACVSNQSSRNGVGRNGTHASMLAVKTVRSDREEQSQRHANCLMTKQVM